MSPIKLIIWDLDETLWRGVLSEGDIEPHAQRIEMVKQLVDRGVVHSVSSKNDLVQARARLQELGLWDLFVVPAINWEPKGSQVRQIIESLQLRAANTLFVDDNHLNRKEVEFFCPGILTKNPLLPEFDPFLREVHQASKPDPERKRLKQYKLLEARKRDATKFDNNIEFLRNCNIQVRVAPAGIDDVQRIHELLARANQLNFTKDRAEIEDITALVQDVEASSYTVCASDNYGDYGLVGFVCLKNRGVRHFCFSCRVMHMGVESFVFHHLECPPFKPVGEVAYELAPDKPGWITLGKRDNSRAPTAKNDKRLLFIGGCDLSAMAPYLSTHAVIQEYFNYPSEKYNLPLHRDSIDFLLSGTLTDDQRRYVLDTSFPVDERCFDLPRFNDFDYIVYSPMIDYVQAKYISPRVPDFYLSFGDRRKPRISDRRSEFLGKFKIPHPVLDLFESNWQPVEKPLDVYERQLDELATLFTKQAEKVVVLVPAETTHSELDADLFHHHQEYNRVLRAVFGRRGSARLVEVGKLTRTRHDFTNAIRHYRREIYFSIAKELVKMLDVETVKISRLSIVNIAVANARAFVRKAMNRRG